MSKRWVNRPDGSTWGDWGDEDQLGRLNLVTPEKVRQGIAEVEHGLIFCLSLPLDYPGGSLLSPVRFPPELSPVTRNGKDYYNYHWHEIDPNLKDIASDEKVTLYTQYSTQWDGLAHRGALFDINSDGVEEPVYYNGYQADEYLVIGEDGSVHASALGIENMAAHGVQGRGVLVDLFSECGETPRQQVGYDQLMMILEKDQVIVEPGDFLCLWTGFDRVVLRMKGQPDSSLKSACAVLDGWDDRLLNWITDSGIAALIADNQAVEALPGAQEARITHTRLPLHHHCLFKLGLPLGELWYLAELAAWLRKHGRSRFLLTAPPLRLTGAVGSPVTPIATV